MEAHLIRKSSLFMKILLILFAFVVLQGVYLQSANAQTAPLDQIPQILIDGVSLDCGRDGGLTEPATFIPHTWLQDDDPGISFLAREADGDPLDPDADGDFSAEYQLTRGNKGGTANNANKQITSTVASREEIASQEIIFSKDEVAKLTGSVGRTSKVNILRKDPDLASYSLVCVFDVFFSPHFDGASTVDYGPTFDFDGPKITRDGEILPGLPILYKGDVISYLFGQKSGDADFLDHEIFGYPYDYTYYSGVDDEYKLNAFDVAPESLSILVGDNELTSDMFSYDSDTGEGTLEFVLDSTYLTELADTIQIKVAVTGSTNWAATKTTIDGTEIPAYIDGPFISVGDTLATTNDSGDEGSTEDSNGLVTTDSILNDSDWSGTPDARYIIAPKSDFYDFVCSSGPLTDSTSTLYKISNAEINHASGEFTADISISNGTLVDAIKAGTSKFALVLNRPFEDISSYDEEVHRAQVTTAKVVLEVESTLEADDPINLEGDTIFSVLGEIEDEDMVGSPDASIRVYKYIDAGEELLGTFNNFYIVSGHDKIFSGTEYNDEGRIVFQDLTPHVEETGGFLTYSSRTEAADPYRLSSIEVIQNWLQRRVLDGSTEQPKEIFDYLTKDPGRFVNAFTRAVVPEIKRVELTRGLYCIEHEDSSKWVVEGEARGRTGGSMLHLIDIEKARSSGSRFRTSSKSADFSFAYFPSRSADDDEPLTVAVTGDNDCSNVDIDTIQNPSTKIIDGAVSREISGEFESLSDKTLTCKFTTTSEYTAHDRAPITSVIDIYRKSGSSGGGGGGGGGGGALIDSGPVEQVGATLVVGGTGGRGAYSLTDLRLLLIALLTELVELYVQLIAIKFGN